LIFPLFSSPRRRVLFLMTKDGFFPLRKHLLSHFADSFCLSRLAAPQFPSFFPVAPPIPRKGVDFLLGDLPPPHLPSLDAPPPPPPPLCETAVFSFFFLAGNNDLRPFLPVLLLVFPWPIRKNVIKLPFFFSPRGGAPLSP